MQLINTNTQLWNNGVCQMPGCRVSKHIPHGLLCAPGTTPPGARRVPASPEEGILGFQARVYWASPKQTALTEARRLRVTKTAAQSCLILEPRVRGGQEPVLRWLIVWLRSPTHYLCKLSNLTGSSKPQFPRS